MIYIYSDSQSCYLKHYNADKWHLNAHGPYGSPEHQLQDYLIIADKRKVWNRDELVFLFFTLSAGMTAYLLLLVLWVEIFFSRL